MQSWFQIEHMQFLNVVATHRYHFSALKVIRRELRSATTKQLEYPPQHIQDLFTVQL
jgi:hypothetical protein